MNAKKDFKEVLKRAESLIKSKNYKEAISELEGLNLKTVDYYLLLAQAYEALGQTDKAESLFEEAKALDSEIRSKEFLKRGASLAAMKNFKAAERELLASLKLNPFDKEAYLELYHLYKETRNSRKMVKVLEDLKTIEPYMTFPYIELSKYYSLRRRYGKAVEILKEASSRIESPEIFFELGKVYAEWGKTEEAKEALREACRLDFKNIDYRQRLAEVMVDAEEYEEALEVVLGTLELYPDAVYVLQSAAALYDLLGDEELAEYYYRKAISASSDFIKEDSLKLFADFLIEKGRYDQAEEVLWELLNETDNSWLLIDAFSELAVILLEQERYKDIVKAGKILLKSSELSDEELRDIEEIVGDALYEDGNYKEALKYYENILERSEDKKLKERVEEKVKEIMEIEELNRLLKKSL
ncbi:tetratricopeptide repeat protein [Thermovibrio sp.]